MIKTKAELTAFLNKTPYAGNKNLVFKPGFDDELVCYFQTVCFVEIMPGEGLGLWKVFKSMMNETGRWPVLSVLCWDFYGNCLRQKNPVASWQKTVYKSYRFLKTNENYFLGLKSEALRTVSPEKMISEKIDLYNILKTEILKQEEIQKNLDQTLERYGSAPSHQQALDLVNTGRINTYIDLEQWLLNWESEHFGKNDSRDMPVVEWYNPPEQEQVLLLIPAKDSWKSFLYLDVLFGLFSAHEQIVVLQYWHEKYGADLIANFETTLQFTVKWLPKDIEEAFQLALEHAAFSFGIHSKPFPSVSVRHHAQYLLTAKTWLLHERL